MRISYWSSVVCSSDLPRVQVGRLRRMLDAYYERYGLVNGERLVIPNGAYRVFLMPIYRNQERPSTPAVEIIAGPDPQDQADPILALKSARQSAASAPPYRRPGIILAVVLSRSEEHTSELQSLMRISYAVFCMKKTNQTY